MSRRVRRRLNNPLDQWTPATVAAAQANRPRTYGTRDFSSAARRDGREPLDATGQGFIYRYQLQGSVFENGFPGAMANYVSGSLNRATARGWTDETWGRVVQTFRQAVARIVRRAKWRRIIRALRMQRRLGDYFERSRPLAGPSSAVRGPNWVHMQQYFAPVRETPPSAEDLR